MLGLGLGLTMRPGGSSIPAFDETTLTASGLWRGSYVGSPWVGTASAGGSASHDISGGSAPAIGTAVNGFTPASFNGITAQLTNGSAVSTWLTASAYFWWSLFYAEATGGANAITAAPASNPLLWGDNNGYMGASFYANGGNEYLQVYHFDSAYNGNTHQIALNTWNLIRVRYDGVNLRSQLNSGSISSLARGSVGSMASFLNVGKGGAAWNGRLMELGFIAGAESDARFDDILSSTRGRYPAMSL